MDSESASAGTVSRGNVTYFPVVPGRLEFACRVRRYLLKNRPRVIAVELPSDLAQQYEKAIARLPKMSAILVPPESDEEADATYIPVEPSDPFVEALRTAAELQAEILFLEPATTEKPHVPDNYPDPHAIELIGMARYVEEYRVHRQTRNEQTVAHAAAMAWKLQGADPLAAVCVVLSLNMLDALLDAMEAPQEEPATGRIKLFHTPELINLHPDCLAEVTSEAPFYQQRYEELRTGPNGPIKRQIWQLDLLRQAEKEYSINTGEKICGWQRLLIAKFTRNLAMLDYHLVPGVYDLTLAARSIVDDNYAYEVWEMANRYSVQPSEDPPLETLNLSGDAVWLRTRKLRIRRRLPRIKQMLKPRGLKARKQEKFEGQWARETTGNSICSYPPEDLVIENYGRFLKRYAKSIVADEKSRVEPFTTSMLDGIDFRETIRNWHKQKLFVRELGKFSGEVGALVIIFDEDRQERYGYLTTWLGEHQNESDMAFYSTFPFDHLVGPGIGRAEYGGLLMTLPPRRMYDIWGDPDYEAAESKPERLLMAALDYSVERHILYIAGKPPRSMFRQLAARLNRKIDYIPLGQLSPAKLKKLRVVHVLDSYARRNEAKDYIW
jgi:hypothetical protein